MSKARVTKIPEITQEGNVFERGVRPSQAGWCLSGLVVCAGRAAAAGAMLSQCSVLQGSCWVRELLAYKT